MAEQTSRLSIVVDTNNAEQAIHRLTNILNRLEGLTARISTSLNGLSSDLNRFGNNINRITNQTNNYNRNIQNINNTTNNLNRTVNNTTNNFNRMGDTINHNTTIINNYNNATNNTVGIFGSLQAKIAGFLATFGGVGYLLTSATKEAIKFESVMADIKKVVNFDTPDGLQNMRIELENLSKEIPIAFDGLAQIAAAAGQSGIATNEIVRFTEAAAKMGTAFDISADEAGQAMAEMRVAFKMSQDDVQKLADQINYLGNSTPNNAAKILKIVQTVGPLGEIAGISASEIAALGASITSLAPEVVSTGLKNMMLALTKGESATKSANMAFKSLGLDAVQISKDIQKDGVGALNQVLEALKKLPEEARTATINDIFGAEALPVIAQMVTGTEALNKNLKAMGDSTAYAGSMLKEYESRSATTANQIELLKNNYSLAKAALGELILPSLNGFISSVIPVMQSVTEFFKSETVSTSMSTAVEGLKTAWDNLNSVIRATAEIIEPVVNWFREHNKISESLALAIGLVAGAFATYNLAVGIGAAVTGAFAAAFAVVSSPVFLAAAALTALTAAAIYVYQNFDELKAKAKEVFDGLPQPVQVALSTVWNIVKTNFQLIKTIFETVGNALGAIFAGEWGELGNIAMEGVGKISNIISKNMGGVIDWLADTMLTVDRAWSDATQSMAKTWQSIESTVSATLEGVKQAIASKLSGAVGIVRTKASEIWEAFRSIVGRMLQIGSDIVQGLINGIRTKANEAIQAARNMADSIASTVKGALQIRSPSRVMQKLGNHTADGMAKGIRESADKVKTEAQKMAEQAVKAVKDSIAQLKKSNALFGNNSMVAEFEYELSAGKYQGVPKALLNSLREEALRSDALRAGEQFRQQLQASARERIDKIKAANESVYDSVTQIDRQLALLNNDNPVDALNWDLNNTKKYADASAEAIDKLKEATQRLYVSQTEQKFGDLKKDLAGQSPVMSLIQQYQEKMAVIDEFEKLHTDKVAEAEEARRNLRLATASSAFGALAGLSKEFLGEQSRVYRALFAVQQSFAFASAGINMYKALSDAMAQGATLPQKLTAYATVAAEFGKIMAGLKGVTMPIGQAHDGIMSVPKSGTWNLEKGERVLPQHTAQALDKRLAEGAGTGTVVNITVNVDAKGNTTMSANDANVMSKQMAHAIQTVVIDTLRKERRQGGMYA